MPQLKMKWIRLVGVEELKRQELEVEEARLECWKRQEELTIKIFNENLQSGSKEICLLFGLSPIHRIVG